MRKREKEGRRKGKKKPDRRRRSLVRSKPRLLSPTSASLTTTTPLLSPSPRNENSPGQKQLEISPAAAADCRGNDYDGDDIFATARDLDLPQLLEGEEGGEGETPRATSGGTDAGEKNQVQVLRPRQQQQQQPPSSSSPWSADRARRAERPSLADYSHVAVIGRGAFGEVRLVRELRHGGRLAALKSLDKAEMLRRRQVAHVRAERDALATLWALGGEGRRRRKQRRREEREGENGTLSSSGGEGDDGGGDDRSGDGSDENDDDDPDASSHVVALRASFQDEKRLHLVMEYLPGGDLMTLLMRMDVLPVVSFWILVVEDFFLGGGGGRDRKSTCTFLYLPGLYFPFSLSLTPLRDLFLHLIKKTLNK